MIRPSEAASLAPQESTEVQRAVSHAGRLAALRRTALLDTPSEPAFDRLTRLAARVLDVPVSLVSLVDEGRQFFKSAIGLPEPWASARETPLTHSFCKHVVATGEPLLIENSRVHPLVKHSGATTEIGVVSYAGMPLTTADGHTLGSFCVIDTRPRVWSEEEIEILRDLADALVYKIELRTAVLEAERERREKTTILRRISDGFFALDAAERIIYLNPRAQRLLGRPRAKLEGLSFWAAFPELAGSMFEREYRRAVELQSTLIFEAHYTPLGSWMEVHLYPSADGVSVYFQDVTERKALEEELRLHDQAIAAVSEGIVIVDARLPDQPIRYANAGFQRLTGYTALELLGRNCRFLQGPDTDTAAVAEVRAALAAGRTCDVELLNYRKDGTPFWNQLSISPVHDADGLLTHFVGVQRDVTARKAAEAALEESRQQLIRAQKMDAFGHLAGGVAHDFNNLVTVIGGYAEMMALDVAEGDPLRGPLDQIRAAAEGASALTRQLLAFSGRQVLRPAVLRLNDVVARFDGMLRRVAGAEVEFVTELDTALAATRVDPGQIEQVLLNLVTNAREAMPGGGRLTLRTRGLRLRGAAAERLELAPGDYVAVSVCDTGSGMDDATRARALEPFFTTKEQGRGAGLGLSSVYGIVRQSGGGMEVRSARGAGTTVEIYLPAHADAAPDAAAPHATGTETILLVEDDPALRALATRILRDRGYTVVPAANAAEALVIAQTAEMHIHLLLTDVVMPRMDGVALQERVREARPEVRVLYMSGYADDVTQRLGALAPGVVLLDKPFTPERLAARVREVLGPARDA